MALTMALAKDSLPAISNAIFALISAYKVSRRPHYHIVMWQMNVKVRNFRKPTKKSLEKLLLLEEHALSSFKKPSWSSQVETSTWWLEVIDRADWLFVHALKPLFTQFAQI